MRAPEDWAARYFDFSNPRDVREKLLNLYGDRAPALMDLIRAGNGTVKRLPIYALPVGHRWRNRKGITLLGDAAHVMPPYGGNGVRVYESEMFERVLDQARYASNGIATSLSHRQLDVALEAIHA
jgi:hypothetical protein